ncbi:MAG: ECF-type sigma factor [Gemmataceae bacterium]
MTHFPGQEPSDHTLLKRVERGEPDAPELIYHRYAEKLLTLARVHTGTDLSARFDPEDILQSVFRTFFRRAGRGDYDLPDDDSLWNLLLVIGLNKLRAKGAYHRAGVRDVRRTKSGAAADEAVRETAAADEIALAELRLALEEVLAGLPASQRVILEGRMAGESVDAIAARTGRSKRTVERGIQEFCRVVRDLIESGG